MGPVRPVTDLDGLLSSAPARADLVVAGARRLSSVTVESDVAAVAGGLRRRGVGPGDPVVLRLPIGPEAVVAYRACWRLGAVAVAVHHRAGDRALAAATESAPAVVLDGVDALGAVGAEGSDPVLAGSGPTPAGHETALVLLTSGSTGPPGSVPHTHAGLAYKVEQLLDVHGLGPDDVVLMPAPLAHVSGLLHGVLVPGVAGMKAVLMDRWSPGDALDLIESEQVTYMVGPPTFFLGLMEAPDFRPERVASLRVLSVGGAGISSGFVERATARLRCVVKRSYGSTEAPTVATSRHDDDPARMATTDGRAFGATELRVDGRGQLLVRGPEVSPAHVDEEGWYATGDLARMEDGWVTVIGRMDDRIIRGGENIDPSEVEGILEAHDAVAQAVVVGEPDARLGQRVVAFVVPAGDGSAGEAGDPFADRREWRRWFAEQGAADYTVPERIVTEGSLPTLASGKPDRAALVRRLVEATP